MRVSGVEPAQRFRAEGFAIPGANNSPLLAILTLGHQCFELSGIGSDLILRGALTSFSLLTCLMLSGCISTQEMPLAQNVVQIDTQAEGWLFTGQAVPQTMRAAANATLSRGYTKFKFAEAGMAQGAVTTGILAHMAMASEQSPQLMHRLPAIELRSSCSMTMIRKPPTPLSPKIS